MPSKAHPITGGRGSISSLIYIMAYVHQRNHQGAWPLGGVGEASRGPTTNLAPTPPHPAVPERMSREEFWCRYYFKHDGGNLGSVETQPLIASNQSPPRHNSPINGKLPSHKVCPPVRSLRDHGCFSTKGLPEVLGAGIAVG